MSASIPASTLEKFTTFGDFLRFLRRRAGMTQVELSIAVGYSDAQISRLEQNLRLPDLPTIEARFVPALYLEHEPEAVTRLLELAANVRREDAPALGLCPYKGLNYFDETDADLFVGRETLTEKLTERVLSLTSNRDASNDRFLAIVGASGSGKSSLVRAGLVPGLRWNQISANWPIHVITPTAHPLESLAASLTEQAGSMVATAGLMDDLAREPRSLNLFVKRLLKSTGDAHLLLVVDQFEELFALCRSEVERSAFIDNLLTTASEEDGAATIVIALRADFYAYCAEYPELREALARQQEYIGAMSAEELRRVIEEPAQRGRWEFEPGLVDLLLHDVGREPGALPLLSHALLETWQRRRGRTMTLSGYTASGGVRGAIAETAEAVFVDQFNPDQRAIARRIFLRLTELGDETATGDTRRRAAFDELILKPEEAAETRSVLKVLADARLITTSEDSAEVAHEALIREWPKLRGWLEDNREGLRLHRHLTEAAREWAAMDRQVDLLHRGARLAQALEWAEDHADEMNPLESEFLDASQAWAEHEAAERELQRQRELEAARKLAEAEKERARLESRRAEEQARAAGQLRKRAVYLAGALVVALGMALVALFFGVQTRQAALRAQDQQRVSFSRELAAAAISNLDSDPERSILLALQGLSAAHTLEAEIALHRAIPASRVELTLSGHTGEVWGIAYHPDGTQLATSSSDGTIKLWDSNSGRELLTLTDDGPVLFIDYNPDGTRLASAGTDGTAKVWDVGTGEILLTLSGHSDVIIDVAFSPNGKYLATSSQDKTARLWDLESGKELLTLTGYKGFVNYVDFSPDGDLLAAGGGDGTVKLWDVTQLLREDLDASTDTTGWELVTLQGGGGSHNGSSFSPDGKLLATGTESGLVRVWDVAASLAAASGQELLTLRGHAGPVTITDFSPDGTRLASASYDGTAKVWDVASGQELFTLAGHTSAILNLGFSPDGTRLATPSWDGTAKVWNLSYEWELMGLAAHASGVDGATAIAFNPDGTRLATSGDDGKVKIWELEMSAKSASARELSTVVNHTAEIWDVALSPDWTRLATASDDGTIGMWDADSGRELFTLTSHTPSPISVSFNGVTGVDFSPDGKYLASVGDDGMVRIWDAATGREVFAMQAHTADYSAASPFLGASDVAFSPDGTRLVTAGTDDKAIVWDISTALNTSISAALGTDAQSGEAVLTLSGHQGDISHITFNQDGTQLATASLDTTARVWDVESGDLLLTLSGHTGGVMGVVFNPDGTRLATASLDGTAKVWDATTGDVLLTLSGHSGIVNAVAFSPHGTRLITAGQDGTVRVYVLPIEDLVALGQSRVTRSLTAEECRQYLHVEACPDE
jgi:WD40 repeat protein/transcriptional regulator with XRE-family HTH domain